MNSVVVLGGGLTGLSVAYRLCRKGFHVTVIEESSQVGGLASSFTYDNYTFDIGPHIFRTQSKNLLSFVSSLTNIISTNSDPKIWKKPGLLHDNVTPIITTRNLSLLSEDKRKRIQEEYQKTKRSNIDLTSCKSFEECIIAQIGETLYNEYFREYTEKWWGLPAKELSAKLAPHNLQIQEKAYYGHVSANYRQYTEEVYPASNGIGAIAQMLANKIKLMGVNIILESKVKDLITDGNKIKYVVVKRDSLEEEYKSDLVVSTIPITDLARMLKISTNLAYRSLISIFIKIRRRQLLRNKWLYFPERELIFGRVSEPKLFSPTNAPIYSTSLCVEVTCQMNDSIWNDEYITYKVVEQLKDINFIKGNETEFIDIKKIPNAYPIYRIGYEEELLRIRSKTATIQNIWIAGRTGSFTYANMDAALAKAIE
jgi:protoporphyrinogen oxidase